MGRSEWEATTRARKAEALDNQPYVSEITLIEQTIFFCKGLVKDKGPVEKQETKEVVHTNKADDEVLVPDREEEMYYVAPKATDDIPALLEKLEEQLAGFQEKVKEWEPSRDEMKAKILAGEDVVEKAEEKAAGGEEAKEE